jgi:phenylalanyl-tRNA synthetase beta chain
MPVAALEGGTMPARMSWTREVKSLLTAQGLSEVVFYSFSSPRMNEIVPGINVGGPSVRLVNPLSRDEGELRRSLLGGLLEICRHNRHQGVRSVALFAVGKVFWKEDNPAEGWRIAGVLAGDVPHTGLGAARAATFADAKGLVESILDQRNVLPSVSWEPARHLPPFHPGKSALLALDGGVVGAVGALHPEAETALDVGADHWLFELDLEKLLSYRPPRRVFVGLPRFPAVVRDLAVVVDADFASDRIVPFVRQWRTDLVEDVSLFDEYVGAPIPDGKKSLAYSISYRAPDRTLTDDEVNALQAELIESLRAEFTIELR